MIQRRYQSVNRHDIPCNKVTTIWHYLRVVNGYYLKGRPQHLHFNAVILRPPLEIFAGIGHVECLTKLIIYSRHPV